MALKLKIQVFRMARRKNILEYNCIMETRKFNLHTPTQRRRRRNSRQRPPGSDIAFAVLNFDTAGVYFNSDLCGQDVSVNKLYINSDMCGQDVSVNKLYVNADMCGQDVSVDNIHASEISIVKVSEVVQGSTGDVNLDVVSTDDPTEINQSQSNKIFVGKKWQNGTKHGIEIENSSDPRDFTKELH